MLASSGLITAPLRLSKGRRTPACPREGGGRPSLHARDNVLVEPASDQAEHATIADPLLDPLHQPLVRDAVEVALEVGVDHEGMAFLDQTVDLLERVATAPPRPEAVAARMERRLEDRPRV